MLNLVSSRTLKDRLVMKASIIKSWTNAPALESAKYGVNPHAIVGSFKIRRHDKDMIFGRKSVRRDVLDTQ